MYKYLVAKASGTAVYWDCQQVFKKITVIIKELFNLSAAPPQTCKFSAVERDTHTHGGTMNM